MRPNSTNNHITVPGDQSWLFPPPHFNTISAFRCEHLGTLIVSWTINTVWCDMCYLRNYFWVPSVYATHHIILSNQYLGSVIYDCNFPYNFLNENESSLRCNSKYDIECPTTGFIHLCLPAMIMRYNLSLRLEIKNPEITWPEHI